MPSESFSGLAVKAGAGRPVCGTEHFMIVTSYMAKAASIYA